MILYYAKLNFSVQVITNPHDENYTTIDYFKELFENSKPVILRGSPFVFTNTELFEIDGANYFVGKVTKYADKDERTIDPSTRLESEVTVENKILAEVLFIIDFSENILLYTENKQHINKNSFIGKFNSLIEASSEKLPFNCFAIKINERYAFYSALKSLDLVYELILKIRPTNPNPTEIIAQVDSKLKSLNVLEKTTKYLAKRGGLRVDDNEIETNSIYTDIGYGIGKAKGIKDGRDVTIESSRGDKQRNIKIDERIQSGLELARKVHELINEKKD